MGQITTYNKLTCLFGHHDYSDREVKDKGGDLIYLCKICKRSGYGKYAGGLEVWSDYDERGNCIHEKDNDGYEEWRAYNSRGTCLHIKYSDGDEFWKNNYGHWARKKPKNWKYEKQIQ